MLLALYVVLLSVYSILSYALTDRNLVFTSWQGYWSLQEWLWHLADTQAHLLPFIYGIFIVLIYGVYLHLSRSRPKLSLFLSAKIIQQNHLTQSIVMGFCVLPLVFAYNALSHDMFNYLFNAKMVIVHQADPHVQVALDFPNDNWTRFMHNVHTPAPYGYGWTIWSLIPYLLGGGYFTLTWLLFKLFSACSLFILLLGMQKLYQQWHAQPLPWPEFSLVFLNPLVLLEIVGNGHNDGWMLAGVVWAFAILKLPGQMSWWKGVISLLLLIYSISIKYVTVLAVPLWIWMLISSYPQINKYLQKYVTRLLQVWPLTQTFFSPQWLFGVLSILLFVPLFTERSQQFLPWYLTWSLIWLPFIRWQWWKVLLIVFSATSLLRYIPWLSLMEYTPDVLFAQKSITWSAVVLVAIIWLIKQWYPNRKKKA